MHAEYIHSVHVYAVHNHAMRTHSAGHCGSTVFVNSDRPTAGMVPVPKQVFCILITTYVITVDIFLIIYSGTPIAAIDTM
jgi:hypothetical protein